MDPMGLFIVGAGVFTTCGAACDWDWFMNNRKAWLFVKMFGRNGARVVYGLLGVGLIVIGALITLGILKNT